MHFLRKLLGPESKYDVNLPYTYEARIPIAESKDLYNSYFADTICGLVDYLEAKGITPEQAVIFEIYEDDEFAIEPSLYSKPDNHWLFRPEICHSFRRFYRGHIQEGKCSFRDRDRTGCGP